MPTLSPAWAPIALPSECAPFGTPLFRPVIGGSRALLIGGGPLGLHIFQVFKTQRLWYSIPAKVWISGFDLQANSLYVQDGPVLSVWDLTIGGCLAAVNLVDGKEYSPEFGFRANADANLAASPMPPVPDWIFELPDDKAALQSELMRARRVAAWAALLEEEDRLWRQDPKTSPGIGPGLRTWLGSTATEMNKPDPAVIAKARVALAKAETAAGPVFFSAPVVRDEQLQGEAAGEVFVIGKDGVLHAFDTALSQIGSASFPEPARPELTMIEKKNATGSYDCKLYYVTAVGGIQAIDGSVNPPESLHGWASTGSPKPDRLLPLRHVDDRLFGGGIFETDFFIARPDVTTGFLPTIDVGGWKDYDVAVPEQLVLLNGGHFWRQISYAPTVKHRERLRYTLTPQPRSYSLFWSGTGGGGATPLLSIEVDGGPSVPPGFRVYLANTLDTEDRAHTNNSYPPAPIALESDSITIGSMGSEDGLPSIAWIRCKPVIAQNVMFCVARSATLDNYAFSIVKDGPGGKPWENIKRAVADAKAAGKTFPAALGEIPLPPMPGRDGLTAFALASRLPTYKTAIDAARASYADAGRPVRIQLSFVIVRPSHGSGGDTYSRPEAQPNCAVKIWGPNVVPFNRTTDGGGNITLENSNAGYTVEPDVNDPCWVRFNPDRRPTCKITTERVTLKPGANQATVYVRYAY